MAIDPGSTTADSPDAAKAQLELRLAEAKAKAEAARLEAEALELEAQLAAVESPPQPQSAEPKVAPAPPAAAKPNGKPKPANPPTNGRTKAAVATPKPKAPAPAKEPTTNGKSADQSAPSKPATAPSPKAHAEKPATPKHRPPGRKTKSAANATAAAAAAATATANAPSPQSLTKSDPPPAVPPATAPASEPESAQAGEAEPFEEDIAGAGRFALLAVPSWMVSLIVHTLGLIILALITVAHPDMGPKVFSLSEIEKDELEELEEMPQIDPLEEKIVIEEEMSFQADDIEVGAIDFGDVAIQPDMETADVGDVATSNSEIVEIGAQFGTEGKGLAMTNEGAGAAQFFGVKSTGRKFVFVVDSSKSMKNGKFEAAMYELMGAISRLKPDQYFYVTFFDHDDLPMFDKENPEERALAATPENIGKLQRWLPKIELELGTKPHASMKRAMEMNPDAIYFLTDGQFNDPTPEYLRKVNVVDDPAADYPWKTRLHTIGFYSDKGRPLLEKMAKENGGTYRFVPDPRKLKKKL